LKKLNACVPPNPSTPEPKKAPCPRIALQELRRISVFGDE
jgi:hypothetical protein